MASPKSWGSLLGSFYFYYEITQLQKRIGWAIRNNFNNVSSINFRDDFSSEIVCKEQVTLCLEIVASAKLLIFLVSVLFYLRRNLASSEFSISSFLA